MLRGVVAFLAVLFCVSSAWAEPTVSDVRIGDHPQKTRFVLELDEAPAYRVFTLTQPYRVVIDLPELRWDVAPAAMRQSAGLISALRYGLFRPGTTRVVLDAKRPVRLSKVFALPAQGQFGHRLVVDLQETSPGDFAAAQQVIASDKPLPDVASTTQEARSEPENQRITVVIDPGHGGVDPGAHGNSGVMEKDVVLGFSKKLARELRATGRYNVVLTRERDIFLKLAERREVARRVDADLFISVHADAHHQADLRGFSVYTLSETASDDVAADLARRENKADLIAGVDLDGQTDEVSSILLDLTQRETMNLSASFASIVVRKMQPVTELLNNTHRFAGFVVLKSHDVPSILVELGFLTNRHDERLLLSDGHRGKVAGALVAAVDRYFSWQQSLRQ